MLLSLLAFVAVATTSFQKTPASAPVPSAPRVVADCGAPITHAAVDATGSTLVVALASGELRAWNLAKDEFTWTSPPPERDPMPALSPNGLAVGQKYAIWTPMTPAPRSVDLRKGASPTEHMLIGVGDKGPFQAVGLTCDPKDRWAWLAFREGVVVRYTPGAANAYNRRAIEGAVPTSIAGDGDETIAVGCEDGSIRFVGASSADVDEKKVLREHAAAVTALAFAGKSGSLVSGAKDGAVIVWNVANGKTKARLAAGEHAVRALAVHPKGKWAAIGDTTGAVKVLGIEKGDVLLDLPTEAGKPVAALLLVDGGKGLAIARGGNDVRIHDASKF